MVNVGNGNLIVQSDDVDIPGRGIDLAFRRTYNSRSGHDASATDGAPASVFGNGWTSTFDAHMSYNGVVMSVYDIDGARYDYSSDGNGGWTPPAGMQGTSLVWDAKCGYQWTKKTGTIYYFWSPTASVPCVAGLAYRGRLYEIFGRNHNNNVIFSYGWVGGDPSVIQNLSTIVAQHSDGDSLTLAFGPANGTGTPTVLKKITRPDGAVIQYGYDSAGNLLEVDRPGNATDDVTRTQNITTLKEQYNYNAGGHQLRSVVGPRYVASSQSGGVDGCFYMFAFDGTASSANLTSITESGVMNITPQDGQATPLQAGAADVLMDGWRTETFSGWGSGTTSWSDSQGHATTWTYDATAARVTKTQEWTNNGGIWLTTYASWDASNNMISSTDARSQETDYGYDANGNTIWVQQPQVTTSLGAGRPLARYAYDQNNNLIAYCDPQYEWTTGASQCQAVGGTTHYTYDYTDANEPFGKLTDTYTPLGYHHHIKYDQNQGDYGLPTTVQGDAITQADNSVRQPTQTFAYDAYGDLTSYNKGNGAWSMTYDSLHRPLTHKDPDNYTSYTCYNVDGSVAFTETPAQHALDGNWTSCPQAAPQFAVSQVYDTDGNVVKAFAQYNRAASSDPIDETDKWYDGADRLVEVKQPHDPSFDLFPFAWMTRYIYDLSSNGTVGISGGAQGFSAYGNLYKTQECTAGASVTISRYYGVSTNASSCSFTDVRGNTFDAVDRAPSKYEVGVGTLAENTVSYDTNGNYGLVASKTNPLNQTITYSYDNAGRIASQAFSDGTPIRTYTYDPNGRISTITSNGGTVSYAYDADGRLTSKTEPSNIDASGVLTYAYYADGMRKTLSLQIPSRSYNQPNLYTYNYRADGARSSLNVAGAGGGAFAWTYTSGGRIASESDPDTGIAPPNSNQLVQRSFTYDTAGQVAQFTAPNSAVVNSFTYDAAGEMLSNNISQSGGLHSYRYTARGELAFVGLGNYPGPATTGSIMFANGAQCDYESKATCTYDARSGGLLSATREDDAVSNKSYTYTRDPAGRETNDGGDPYVCGAEARNYNAEDHIISMSGPQRQGTASYDQMDVETCDNTATSPVNYAWDAEGHLSRSDNGIYTGPVTYHWDGDTLLYQTTTGTGIPDYINVEKLGVIATASGTSTLTVLDRDWTGTVVAVHASGSASGYTPSTGKPFGKLPQYRIPGQLTAPRTDGYYDGLNTFQGVRSYDPTMDQWTTPDAYSGDLHDPMSQHPYVWNANNATSYSDPTGFYVAYIADPIMEAMVGYMIRGSTTFAALFSFLAVTDTKNTFSFKMNSAFHYGGRYGGAFDESSRTIEVGSVFTRASNIDELAHETAHAYDWSTHNMRGELCGCGSDQGERWASAVHKQIMDELSLSGYDPSKIDAIIQSMATYIEGQQAQEALDSLADYQKGHGGEVDFNTVTETIARM